MDNDTKAVEILGCQGRSKCLICGGRLSVENGCKPFRDITAMGRWKDEQLKNCMNCSDFEECFKALLKNYSDDRWLEIIDELKSPCKEWKMKGE